MFTTLEKVGLVCISILGFILLRTILKFLYNNFIATALRINAVNVRETGKWAVVTGSTDGIGKAYAELLAKKGLNIVLISRTQEKLDDVASEIASKYKVETKTIAADFTKLEPIYYDIDKQLTGLDIGILINNVGMSYSYPEYFLDITNGSEVFSNLINCNIVSVTNMCNIVMRGMVERKRGVVVNVASTAANIPSPMLSVYAATKSYVQKFSTDLNAEYAKDGLVIQCLSPGYVATNMSKIRSSTWMAPSPQKYVASALKTIGVLESTPGYFPHKLLTMVVDITDFISPNLSRWLIIRTMQNIRGRALRRAMH